MDRIPRFSIVTPSLNQAPYVAETIESVLSQAGQFEIEYIVIDGASSDGSVEIIKGYADRVLNNQWPAKCAGISMQWTSRPDKGQTDAINQGLRRATGDILAYINSDDAYFPDAFDRIANEFTARLDADFIYGDGDVIDETGNVRWEWLSRPYDHAVMTSYHFLWNDFTNYIMQQATFWRRRVMDRIGVFDETFHYAMDAEYWIRAGDAGLKLQHVPLKLGRFRMIQGTKSLSNPTVFWGDYLEIFRRYRGRRSLGIYFAFFLYKTARHLKWDLSHAWEQGQATFERWDGLPLRERLTLKRQEDQGFRLACLLTAVALQRERRDAEAAAAFHRGLLHAPLLVFHPFCAWYLVRRIAGPAIMNRLEAWGQKLIRWYRRHRYDYRYHAKRGERGA